MSERPAQAWRAHKYFHEIENDAEYQKGTIWSLVTPNPEYHPAPEGFEEFEPLTLALVEFPNGRMLTVQLTDVWGEQDKIKIGDEVELVVRKLEAQGERGPIVYGVKYRPVLEEN